MKTNNIIDIKNFDTSLYLCFADRGTLYFSDKKAEDMWGDDWNDAPLEHNAGLPYEDRCNYYLELYISKDFNNRNIKTFDEEMEDLGCSNSPYCAEDLNKQIMHEWAQLIENQEYYKQEVLKRYFANSNFKEILKNINDNKILCSAKLYKIQKKNNGFADKIKIGEYKNFRIQDS